MRADMSGSTQKTAVSTGRSPCAPRKGLPMSERQQLALVMQMCASDKSASIAATTSTNTNTTTTTTSTSNTTSTRGSGSPPGAGLSSPTAPAASSSGNSRSGRSRNERGETPLHIAAIRGDVALTRRLLTRGADPNCTDFAGWTPLHEASNRGRHQVAEWLLRAGANVNARGLEDDTPLHDAAVNGHSELVQLLLEHGADQHQKNRRGQTPREVAAPRVLAYLLQHDAKNSTAVSAADTNSSAHTSDAASPRSEVDDSKPGCSTSSAGAESAPAPPSTSLDQTPPRTDASDTGAAPCEMRRAPTQNKVDKSGSPRVTLRLHQLKGRDEKRSSQQQNKGTDAASYETRLQFSISMEQGSKGDDVYEFKSGKDAAPVSGNSPDTENNKNTGGNKQENEGREQTATSSPSARAPSSPASKDEASKESEANKRAAAEMDGSDDIDEESKRKKRKEDKSESKDSSRSTGGSGRSTGRNVNSDKSSKSSSASTKGTSSGKSSVTGGSSSGAGSGGDRKSPSNSGSAGNSPKAPPSKPSSAQGDSESDGDDGKKDTVSGSGPKVPPLKIVIPQQSSTEQEQGTRNGKNGNGRHQALPYVVTSSNDSEQGVTTDKLDSGSNLSGLSKDEKKDAAALQEERSQRVLRSSHRSSNHGSGGVGLGAGSSLGLDSMANSPSPSKSDEKPDVSEHVTVDVHPRKRKIKSNKESSIESSSDPPSSHTDVHPHDQPITNCYEMFLNIRKQIDRRRKGLFPVQPKPPQGFKDYLMNRCTYVLAGNATSRQVQMLQPPMGLAGPMKDLFTEQEKERYRLCLQHVIEKEKLVLSVEQEILRVHGRAARALANQSLPFSVCTILKDEEVYNVITPEQEEKDRNARSRYNGRLFLSWLQDVDDKWEKIKENMLLRHHNEAESLHAVQKMDWEWKLKEHSLCEFKAKPVIDDTQVPIVHVSDDFDLLPA